MFITDLLRDSNSFLLTDTNRELLDTIPGFDAAIRNFMIGTINQTYRIIAKEEFSTMLNIKANDVDTLISSKGWEHTADTITFFKPEEAGGLIKSRKTTENIKFEGNPFNPFFDNSSFQNIDHVLIVLSSLFLCSPSAMRRSIKDYGCSESIIYHSHLHSILNMIL